MRVHILRDGLFVGLVVLIFSCLECLEQQPPWCVVSVGEVSLNDHWTPVHVNVQEIVLRVERHLNK